MLVNIRFLHLNFQIIDANCIFYIFVDSSELIVLLNQNSAKLLQITYRWMVHMRKVFDICDDLRDGLVWFTTPFVEGLYAPVRCRKREKSLAGRDTRRSQSQTASVAKGSHNEYP